MRSLTALLLALGLMVSACGDETGADTSGVAAVTSGPVSETSSTSPESTAPSADTQPGTVTILSHDSFAEGVTEETFEPFTQSTGIEVQVLPAGDAGSMVNQAILTKDDPLADVLFGVDDTFLSRALGEGIFRPTDLTPTPLVDGLVTDPEGRVIPIDFGDVCINYDRAALDTVPDSLDDLTEPAFQGTLVVESPATSSPGLAFLLATIAEYGEDGWQDYWASLLENDVRIVGDWDQAYYSEFTRYGGDRPLVVSYASSPPAEVIFAEEPLDEAPTAVVEAGCYRQTEFAGVLEGTERPAEAEALLEYLFSLEFQEQIPLSWFVFPANAEAQLPTEFTDHTVVPDTPASIDAAEIAANRERWIEEWNTLVSS
ncbi:MAG: thiamine ABC transporter substrate-binding protein [Acidimicrobiia bacterium]|nr:thiamine ABC transporter substrate-binding protein [Acidimicrobiia bacterium]